MNARYRAAGSDSIPTRQLGETPLIPGACSEVDEQGKALEGNRGGRKGREWRGELRGTRVGGRWRASVTTRVRV
ncbi:MAG: hypothetical protein P4L61_00220 [Candidatus Pacebacteria bacterium]|nr:hypothetical protein [Candidatus Paceibacterota bacterium]